jgi:hypothetical protein
MHRALWVAQGVLALVFLFAGGMKLITPAEVLAAQMALPLPIAFVKFVACCEVLGAFGLVLPGLLGIRPGLTPVAAAGLVVVMVGATGITLATLGVGPALLPLAVGLLAAFVADGRRRGGAGRGAPGRPEFRPA